MEKRINIQIFPDGRIQAETLGIKGKKCTDYLRLLEEILDAEAVDSSYKPEYHEAEEVVLDETHDQRLQGYSQ